MPIKIKRALPAYDALLRENIFVMAEKRASMQDIRPLEIAIVNLMPKKIETEIQLLRVLSNSPLQVNIELIKMSSHKSKNTSEEHLTTFYKTFDEISHRRFDGMIITGAPVENMKFEEVNYWEELSRIMEWSRENVFSTFHICWGAQAGLHYHYNIDKYPLEKKCFGVFTHNNLKPEHPLLRGFDMKFLAPHSRHTEIKSEDIERCQRLILLSDSEEAGAYIASNHSGRRIFITGHSEYDSYTLDAEYRRDIENGSPIDIPKNYYIDNDPAKGVQNLWRAHSHLLFSNWLNYFVYQNTPYDLGALLPVDESD